MRYVLENVIGTTDGCPGPFDYGVYSQYEGTEFEAENDDDARQRAEVFQKEADDKFIKKFSRILGWTEDEVGFSKAYETAPSFVDSIRCLERLQQILSARGDLRGITCA